ncbi:UvrD-helicase domain-containing protein, partial [Thermodesulfobacteriota bacterium]
MFQDLTLQQFCALDYHRNMVVTSGPGAGKTRILSHRFCFILLTDDSVSIPQILTLTFTEKAAEEMKGRIYEMLTQLDRDLGTGTDEKLIKKIREARGQFHRNRISTIHSFCANLLREHPVESGVDPGFIIIQGAKKRDLMAQSIEAGISSVWQRDRDLLMPLLQAFGSRKNLIRAVHDAIDHPLVFKRIMGTKERLFRTNGWANQIFRDYCRLIKDKSIIPYLKGLRELSNGKGKYKELLQLLEDWYECAEEDQEGFNVPNLFRNLRGMVTDRKSSSPTFSIREGIRKISYLDLVEEYYPDIFLFESPDLAFERELNLFIKVANVCMDQYVAEKEKINALDFSDLEARSHSFLIDLYENNEQSLLKRIQKRFRYIMVDEFQDTNRVQWDIIRLLCSYKDKGEKDLLQPKKLFVVGDKRQSIYRFRGGDVTLFESVTEKIKESNPENPVQMFWERRDMDDLIAKIYKGYPKLQRKQSEGFDSLSSSEKENILNGYIYLPHNFRTDSGPIDFFNRIFKEIFGNKGAGKPERFETASELISMPDGNMKSPRNKGSVTFYLTRASSERKGQAVTEAALIADIIERIMGKRGKSCHEYMAYPDIREKIENNQKAIGILFFRFSHLKSFEDILRDAGLPFKVHRGKGFYRCQEVMEMLQLLNYLTDERQRISLLSALRSPIFGLTDPEIFDLFYGETVTLDRFLLSENQYVRQAGRQIKSWRFLTDRLPIAELIRKIIYERSLMAIYSVHPNGMQRIANIEKLIKIARRFQSEGNGALSEFIKYCLEMADEEEEEGEAMVVSEGDSPISLMTVHAAKGLEFPMVIIPDLDRRLPARPRTGRPVRLYSSEKGEPGVWNFQEGEIPVWQVEIPGLDYLKKYSPLGHLLMRRNRLEDMAESRRVFYVGCTRARNHLVLIGSMKKSLMEKQKRSLTSEDYRERATILELLDDIYRFNLSFPREQSKIYADKGRVPSIIWSEPESRKFKGVYYDKLRLDSSDFGAYDDRIKKLDLTEPIQTPPYFQFSFKSVRIFKRCPVKFYYSVILGIKMEGSNYSGFKKDVSLTEGARLREDDEIDGSGKALFLGTLIHEYLEKHHFGNPLDEDLLNSIWERLSRSGTDAYDFDKDTLLSLREKTFNQLKNSVTDERLVRFLKGEVSYGEIPFLFSISQGIEFRGTIDRLFRDRNKGHWAIIDWKSNDLKERDPGDVAVENDYYLQLACYKLAV